MIKKATTILLFAIILSFKTNEEKTYSVKLKLEEWEAVLSVIEQSNAPHTQVKAVQQLLIPVLQKQISDTIKK